MKILMVVLAAWIHASSLAAQTVDDLTFLTEHYPPFNYEEDKKLQGIAVETLREMFKLVDTKKTLQDVKLWPWARGYSRVMNTKNTVLFSTARTEAREKLFKWVGPIAPSHVVVLAKKSRKVKVDSVENFSQYRIGVVRDDIGEQLLLQLGVKKESIHQTISGISAAKMLHSDRIDVWAYEEIIALWNLRIIEGNPQDYETVYSLKRTQYFFAFHKQYGGQFSLTKKCRSRRLGIIDHHVNDTLYLERRHNGTGRKDTQEFQDFQASKKVSDGCVYSDPNSSRQDQFS